MLSVMQAAQRPRSMASFLPQFIHFILKSWVNAEFDTLREVIMHRPGPEIEYAMLAPKQFLFERPFRSRDALKENEALESILRENGVKVSIYPHL